MSTPYNSTGDVPVPYLKCGYGRIRTYLAEGVGFTDRSKSPTLVHTLFISPTMSMFSIKLHIKYNKNFRNYHFLKNYFVKNLICCGGGWLRSNSFGFSVQRFY